MWLFECEIEQNTCEVTLKSICAFSCEVKESDGVWKRKTHTHTRAHRTLLLWHTLTLTRPFNHMHELREKERCDSFSFVNIEIISSSAHTHTRLTHTLNWDSIRTTFIKCDQDINNALNGQLFASWDVMLHFTVSFFSYLLPLKLQPKFESKGPRS